MIPLGERRKMVTPKQHAGISITKQCSILQIHKSGFYYKPRGFGEADQEIMLWIDKFHLKDPTIGTRRMVKYLAKEGIKVGRDKVRTLMKHMRIKTVYCKPRTTILDKGKYKYPYLLKDLKVTRPNQVWAIDITYIPMAKGFMYMCAIIDLYSRYTVNWSISNTMDKEWVVQMVKEAIEAHGSPEIINSDQGSQFTSDEYLELLRSKGVKVSMDGKGRAIDNIFIERFWRTIKHDKIYLYPPCDGVELYRIIQEFVNYYNHERLHESLDYQAPVNLFRRAA